VPRKNIRQLAGKPLLQYTVEAARGSRDLTRVLVSTEDAEISAWATAFGVEVVERPAALAMDETPMPPVVRHALQVAEAGGNRYDYVCTLQPTTPLRSSQDIDAAIRLLRESAAESVIGVVRLFDGHPARVKRIVADRLQAFCTPEQEGTRRQDLEPAYLRNGAIYVTRRDVLEGGSIFGGDQRPYEMPPERSINIDEPLDFLLAELVVAGGLINS
jgi:CMP-N-acetylneuraminic acid synthetase